LLRTTISFLIILFFSGTGFAQEIYGCSDPKAKNYNVLTTSNDGSCSYKATIYNPPFKYLMPDEVKETSGLIYYDNAIWTINDSGNLPILYKLTPEAGEVIQRIIVTNTKNNDWEALAQDDEYIFIGDFGNNSGNRKDLGILKIKKDEISDSGDIGLSCQLIEFSYSDYPGRVEKKKENNFDCESMICIGDSLYLFSKNRGDAQTKLYRLPKKEGSYNAELIDTFNSQGLVTGADYNESSKEVTLVGYTNKTWQPFIWLLFDYKNNDLFSGNKRRVDMLNIPATQTEAIAYIENKDCIITSEGHKLFSQTAYDLKTGKWTDGADVKSIENIGLIAYEVTATPETITNEKLVVEINNAPKGNYLINLLNEEGTIMISKEIKIKNVAQNSRTKLKTHNLKPGNYKLQVISETNVKDLKIIKIED